MTSNEVFAYLIENTLNGKFKWVRIDSSLSVYETLDPTYDNRAITVIMDRPDVCMSHTDIACKVSTDGKCLAIDYITVGNPLVSLLAKYSKEDNIPIKNKSTYEDHIEKYTNNDVVKYLKLIQHFWMSVYCKVKKPVKDGEVEQVYVIHDTHAKHYEGYLEHVPKLNDTDEYWFKYVQTNPDHKVTQFNLSRKYYDIMLSTLYAVVNNIRVLEE